MRVVNNLRAVDRGIIRMYANDAFDEGNDCVCCDADKNALYSGAKWSLNERRRRN